MKTTTYSLEFITPCFCAGANQAKAEIRPSAIRGQLRWWFRALGATPDEESRVFGSINGNLGTASSLIIRVKTTKMGVMHTKLYMNDDRLPFLNYVLHFIEGSREATPPARAFDLIIIQKKVLSPALQAKLDLAIECFCRLGCLGLRATRGLGAMKLTSIDGIAQKENQINLDALKDKLVPVFPDFILHPASFSTWKKAIDKVGQILNKIRTNPEKKISASKPSPLGTAKPRQTSSIYFRPVMIEGKYQILIFRAPSYVLDPESAKVEIDLSHIE